MSKKLEHDKEYFNVEGNGISSVVEVMQLLKSVQIETDEARLNKESMKDALGRRIHY